MIRNPNRKTVYDSPCSHLRDIIFYSGYKNPMRFCQKCGNIWYEEEESKKQTKIYHVFTELTK